MHRIIAKSVVLRYEQETEPGIAYSYEVFVLKRSFVKNLFVHVGTVSRKLILAFALACSEQNCRIFCRNPFIRQDLHIGII